MSHELKVWAINWANQYGPIACVAFVLLGCLSAARKPRGPRR